MAAPRTARTGLRRLAARGGVRLALIQAAVVITAFSLAGVLTRISLDRLETASLRERVQGEARSLEEEFVQRGGAHLPHTIAKRTRLWRGFAYRLDGAGGAPPAGTLPSAGALGWSSLNGAPGDRDFAKRPFLVFTEALPDGTRLSVGQDLSAQHRQSATLTWVLLACGGCGVLFCVLVSSAFIGRSWRRVAAVADAARQVREGRLEVRAPTRAGPPGDDLDDLGQAFNAMLERIEILVDQVRQVSNDIAHDLRTPLTRVRQRLERLKSAAGHDRRLAREVEEVETDIAEILRTFDALLQLTEIGGRDCAGGEAFDLGALAQSVGEAFRPDIEEGGRKLDLACSAARVRGDARLVAQAVANLLENAMRHTPRGTRVSLTVVGADPVRLTVADDGPGVPDARRADILRPLVRLESSRHLPGSGLGLSIVAAVAARHGAGLELSEAGPGLAVAMTFAGPSPGQAGAEAPPGPPRPQEVTALARSSGAFRSARRGRAAGRGWPGSR